MTPSHSDTYAIVEEDPGASGVRVIRAFYRFPQDTTLQVGSESIGFRKGDAIQYVESRRFPASGVGEHLRRHGLELVDAEVSGNHGLFLCRLSQV